MSEENEVREALRVAAIAARRFAIFTGRVDWSKDVTPGDRLVELSDAGVELTEAVQNFNVACRILVEEAVEKKPKLKVVK